MATKLVSFWKLVQVELQGKYSTQRVQALFKYHDYVSSLRVFLVLLVTPLPCFLLILAVDEVPLRPISEGVHSSQLFFVRAFVCFWIASITAYGQIKHIVPPAPLSNAKIIYLSGIVAGITVGVMYALTLVIGYPLPFGIVTVSPVWVNLLLAPFLSWMKKARADPEVWTMCVNLVKIMDEIPQIVVINVDLFSALFSTYCIQNTPSLKTTGVLMAAKAIQTSVSLTVATIAPLLAEFIDDDQRGPSKVGVADATASKSIKYRYVRELRRVLYITECVVLVNYVEVVIPLIFSAYLFAILVTTLWI
ncbi:hypothetical protein PF005_g8326 [Phytophthora fragariae]|uniref:Uncharacterized protein n=1 Tax=Phytophthora fragariae TaxID=53985 RepID=A0A6A3YG20_9STRA|nr:hypothetical protein PF005_g8326 [Phytophthora fragariae]